MVPESLVRRHALLLAGDDEQREHRQHRAVHGHGHRDLVERDAVEQSAHVVDGIDGDARHADIAGDARMIRIVAAMGGEVEGDGDALLAAGEVAAVEGVGILGGGEARILADGPGPLHIHGGVGAAQERCESRVGIEEIEAGEIVRAIGGLDGDAFRRLPSGAVSAGAAAGASARERRRRSWRRPGCGSCVQSFIGLLQQLKRITALMKECRLSRPRPRPSGSRPACRPDRGAWRLPQRGPWRPRPPRSHRSCRTSRGRRASRQNL